MPYLAGFGRPPHTVALWDEYDGPFDLGTRADLVAITCNTPNASHVYAMADDPGLAAARRRPARRARLARSEQEISRGHGRSFRTPLKSTRALRAHTNSQREATAGDRKWRMGVRNLTHTALRTIEIGLPVASPRLPSLCDLRNVCGHPLVVRSVKVAPVTATTRCLIDNRATSKN
jgi:hypothetical protein